MTHDLKDKRTILIIVVLGNLLIGALLAEYLVESHSQHMNRL